MTNFCRFLKLSAYTKPYRFIRNAVFIIGILFSPVFLPADDGSTASADAEGGITVPAEVDTALVSGQTAGMEPAAGIPDSSDQPAVTAITAIEDSAKNIERRLAFDTGTVISYVRRFGIALGIIAVQALLIWLVWRLFDRFKVKLAAWGGRILKPLTIKKLRLLTTRQMVEILVFFLKVLKYIVTAFQLFITIPIVFSLFPVTKNLASTLFGYILTPLKNIVIETVKYIPNLITIIIILLLTRYAVRALKFFATQIERERLVIPRFYPDWAQPTFNILRVLLYAFTIAVVYPYLPGSGSPIFQGVTVFVGVIFSLGSSSAVGNLIAGLVITYMRSFKIGDRIQIKDTTGFVVEKTLMVIRIRTHKNEYVTFPNLMILNSSIINYHTSSDEAEEGLILHTDVTMGYAVPWTTVHEILIAAAVKTTHILKTPKPFVLQTALDDFYAKYQINAYTKEIDRVPAIYSELYQNLQDGFKAAGIDLTAPAYQIRMLQESPSKIPREKTAAE